jgi:hypothetical protein
MRCCPAAENPNQNFGPFATWGSNRQTADPQWGWGGTWTPEEGVYGSYAFSRYMLNKKDEGNWGKTGVKEAEKVPVFLDCQYVALNPVATDGPPQYNGDRSNQMQYACIDRHIQHINSLFLDFSVRKVGLKELWTLRWSRTFDTANVWTKAGGVQPEDWPEWMRSFKDY